MNSAGKAASPLRQLPNAITVARMLAVLPLVWLLRSGFYRDAALLVLLAGASDAIDGWLAKRYGWQSRLGALLDPVADKLLLDACFLGLWGAGHLPTWLAALVVGRDVVILLGATAYHWLVQPLAARPSLLSKATTLAQVLLVLLLLVHLAWWPLPSGLHAFGIGVVAALTTASGADYVLRWSIKARRARRNRSGVHGKEGA